MEVFGSSGPRRFKLPVADAELFVIGISVRARGVESHTRECRLLTDDSRWARHYPHGGPFVGF